MQFAAIANGLQTPTAWVFAEQLKNTLAESRPEWLQNFIGPAVEAMIDDVEVALYLVDGHEPTDEEVALAAQPYCDWEWGIDPSLEEEDPYYCSNNGFNRWYAGGSIAATAGHGANLICYPYHPNARPNEVELAEHAAGTAAWFQGPSGTWTQWPYGCVTLVSNEGIVINKIKAYRSKPKNVSSIPGLG